MKFVIIGNGVAGITAAFTIRTREPEAEIVVISGESDFFFSRTALMYAYMDKMSLRDLEPYERDVWRKQRIDLIRDWVVDLDAKAHTLRLKSGRELPYDRLLIATGSVPNRIPWPGMDRAREGVVHFVSLQHLAECERLTRPGGHAVVVGGGLIGVELVECLRHHGMNVTFLVREPWYWPMALGAEEGRLISEHISGHGVDLLHEEEVAEVHVDDAGRVEAVSTNKGQRLTCDLFGVAVGVRPAIAWLEGVATPPELGRGVVVDASFATSLEHVYAAGDVAEVHRPGERPSIEAIWYSDKLHGELAGRAMLGDAIDYHRPLFYNSSKFFEIEYTTVGRPVEFPAAKQPLACQTPAGASSFYWRPPGEERCVRIVECNGAVIGFNMLGSRWDHSFFERWIRERRSLAYVVEHLDEAQFDVEFGRASLAGLRGEFVRWRDAGAGSPPENKVLEEV